MNGALSKAQPPVLNAQSCLVPDPVWNWEIANGFEAGVHFSIEGHQCCTVEPSGGGAHVVHKLGEGCAVPQQLQTDLWSSSPNASKTFPAFCTLSERVAKIINIYNILNKLLNKILINISNKYLNIY